MLITESGKEGRCACSELSEQLERGLDRTRTSFSYPKLYAGGPKTLGSFNDDLLVVLALGRVHSCTR